MKESPFGVKILFDLSIRVTEKDKIYILKSLYKGVYMPSHVQIVYPSNRGESG